MVDGDMAFFLVSESREQKFTLISVLISFIFGLFFTLNLLGLYEISKLLILAYFFLTLLISGFTEIYMLSEKRKYQFLAEILTSFILGFLFIAGLYLLSGKYMQLGIFISSLAVYHMAEYLFVCTYHYSTISFNSFLINQSWYYVSAQVFGFIEYFLEIWLLGEYKIIYIFIISGFLLMTIGQIMRIGALFSAGRNFHHVIQRDEDPNHVLITSGLYAFCRHPGYLGWYLWAVASQIVLVNPISVFVYCVACHMFFKVRIEYEEETLINMFGIKYIEYMKKVNTFH